MSHSAQHRHGFLRGDQVPNDGGSSPAPSATTDTPASSYGINGGGGGGNNWTDLPWSNWIETTGDAFVVFEGSLTP